MCFLVLLQIFHCHHHRHLHHHRRRHYHHRHHHRHRHHCLHQMEVDQYYFPLLAVEGSVESK